MPSESRVRAAASALQVFRCKAYYWRVDCLEIAIGGNWQALNPPKASLAHLWPQQCLLLNRQKYVNENMQFSWTSPTLSKVLGRNSWFQPKPNSNLVWVFFLWGLLSILSSSVEQWRWQRALYLLLRKFLRTAAKEDCTTHRLPPLSMGNERSARSLHRAWRLQPSTFPTCRRCSCKAHGPPRGCRDEWSRSYGDLDG